MITAITNSLLWVLWNGTNVFEVRTVMKTPDSSNGFSGPGYFNQGQSLSYPTLASHRSYSHLLASLKLQTCPETHSKLTAWSFSACRQQRPEAPLD
jgi:hypothetical protein